VPNLNHFLSKLESNAVQVSDLEVPPVFGAAPVQIAFDRGARLKANYWRLLKDGKVVVSSFDHQQIYGLPKPIDAIDELRKTLGKKTITHAEIDRETGDLRFQFDENVRLQIFNVSCYEVWELTFPDGTSEYSNYNK